MNRPKQITATNPRQRCWAQVSSGEGTDANNLLVGGPPGSKLDSRRHSTRTPPGREFIDRIHWRRELLWSKRDPVLSARERINPFISFLRGVHSKASNGSLPERWPIHSRHPHLWPTPLKQQHEDTLQRDSRTPPPKGSLQRPSSFRKIRVASRST